MGQPPLPSIMISRSLLFFALLSFFLCLHFHLSLSCGGSDFVDPDDPGEYECVPESDDPRVLSIEGGVTLDTVETIISNLDFEIYEPTETDEGTTIIVGITEESAPEKRMADGSIKRGWGLPQKRFELSDDLGCGVQCLEDEVPLALFRSNGDACSWNDSDSDWAFVLTGLMEVGDSDVEDAAEALGNPAQVCFSTSVTILEANDTCQSGELNVVEYQPTQEGRSGICFNWVCTCIEMSCHLSSLVPTILETESKRSNFETELLTFYLTNQVRRSKLPRALRTNIDVPGVIDVSTTTLGGAEAIVDQAERGALPFAGVAEVEIDDIQTKNEGEGDGGEVDSASGLRSLLSSLF